MRLVTRRHANWGIESKYNLKIRLVLSQLYIWINIIVQCDISVQFMEFICTLMNHNNYSHCSMDIAQIQTVCQQRVMVCGCNWCKIRLHLFKMRLRCCEYLWFGCDKQWLVSCARENNWHQLLLKDDCQMIVNVTTFQLYFNGRFVKSVRLISAL